MNTTATGDHSLKLRRHERLPQSCVVDIAWSDASGNDKFQRVGVIDISDAGMQIEMLEPLRERIYVTLRAENLGVHGTASVRSCVRKGIKYRVGLEFGMGIRRSLSD